MANNVFDDPLLALLWCLIPLLQLNQDFLIFFLQSVIFFFYLHMQLYLITWIIASFGQQLDVTLEFLIFTLDSFLLLRELFQSLDDFSHFRFTFLNGQFET